LGKADTSYRKVTFHKEHLELDQHLDAILVGPGHPLYAAVDERLNERLNALVGGMAVFLDEAAEAPYRLYFFEMAIRGQNTRGESQTLHGELVAVREDLAAPTHAPERFAVVPADCLLDLPAHAAPPAFLEPLDPAAASDVLKSTYQMELRSRCLAERRHFVEVCRDYLERSFSARIRAAQDRVMALRFREATEPEVGLARQRAENDLADLERTRRERLAGLDRLTIVRHGPVRHLATAVVLPVDVTALVPAPAPEDIDPNMRRRSEKAAEDLVVAYETEHGWECERVGHLKIGFDVRSLGPADPQTGYRDPVEGIRRIEVKGRTRAQAIRLTTNEWYKATQLSDSYWLYVVWDPLGKTPELVRIQNPVTRLDHAKREIVTARFYEISAGSVNAAAQT
jgi:hypothetical protein